ncbi:MAG: hypothetical protein PHY26_03615 [Bacilli bacterium]|nr:hypothetical protein [Bacilli bacterium]MDD3502106.1 hypothetical protein [Candidatus Cloacimonadota bacterium]
MSANKLTIWEVASGYKNTIDREDRYQIDAKRLAILLNDWRSFVDVVEKVRNTINLKPLISSQDAANPPIKLFQTRYGVNSKFVQSLNAPDSENIEAHIYKNIMIKLGLSFNFYPFIEWFLLYDELLPLDLLPGPNPNMVNIYIKYPEEFIRNYHTASDKKHFIQQIKRMLGIIGKPNKEYGALLKEVKNNLSLNNNAERRPRDWNEFKIALRSIRLHGTHYIEGDIYGARTYERMANDIVSDHDEFDRLSEPELKELGKRTQYKLQKSMDRIVKLQKKYLKN